MPNATAPPLAGHGETVPSSGPVSGSAPGAVLAETISDAGGEYALKLPAPSGMNSSFGGESFRLR